MEKPRPDTERRKDLRLDMFEPLLIKFFISKGKSIFKLHPKKYASTRNISINGALLELLALGKGQVGKIITGRDKLTLQLDIPSFKRPVRIQGKIVWMEKKDSRGKVVYEAGICFEDIKAKDRVKLLPLLVNLCLKGKAKI